MEDDGTKKSAPDDQDARELQQEIAINRLQEAVVEPHLPGYDGPDAGDMMADDARAVIGQAMLRVGTSPEFTEFAGRPRSPGARIAGLLVGAALVTGLALGVGYIGPWIAGYVLLPLLGPFVAIYLARALWQANHHIRLPRPESDGMTVFGFFLTGATVAYVIAMTIMDAWLRDGGIALVGPILALALGLITLPMYYSSLND